MLLQANKREARFQTKEGVKRLLISSTGQKYSPGYLVKAPRVDPSAKRNNSRVGP